MSLNDFQDLALCVGLTTPKANWSVVVVDPLRGIWFLCTLFTMNVVFCSWPVKADHICVTLQMFFLWLPRFSSFLGISLVSTNQTQAKKKTHTNVKKVMFLPYLSLWPLSPVVPNSLSFSPVWFGVILSHESPVKDNDPSCDRSYVDCRN